MAQKQAGSLRKQAEIQPLFLDIPQVCESLRLSRAKVYRLIYLRGLAGCSFRAGGARLGDRVTGLVRSNGRKARRRYHYGT